MKIRKPMALLLAATVLSVPVSASAGLGGLAGMGKKMLGDGSDSGVSSADAGSFLDGAMSSTKNVMISAALLAQALKDRDGLASQSEEIAAIKNAQNFGELNAHKGKMQENFAVLNEQGAMSDKMTAAYQTGNAKQKAVIGTALANLALGVMRNVKLAGAAPGMLQSVGTNPQLMTRMGEFKNAASLLGMQGKGLGTIGAALPKLMTGLKIKPLPEAETTKPVEVSV
ncbi:MULTISPECIES: hypothetical protein [unclassified Novosphingobium]|uniref:hypothetical protein n=1 Tax=unclassified Novosphingobium TaxID=2644732 RepID=UPI001357F4F1|nr:MULTISPECIES: hypothetical protein [unclassified Novosphingobium]